MCLVILEEGDTVIFVFLRRGRDGIHVLTTGEIAFKKCFHLNWQSIDIIVFLRPF